MPAPLDVSLRSQGSFPSEDEVPLTNDGGGKDADEQIPAMSHDAPLIKVGVKISRKLVVGGAALAVVVALALFATASGGDDSDASGAEDSSSFPPASRSKEQNAGAGPAETVYYFGGAHSPVLLRVYLILRAIRPVRQPAADTQIGMGDSGPEMDARRFEVAARDADGAAAVVVAGDIVNEWNNQRYIDLASEALARFDAPQGVHLTNGVHLVPGNHDTDSHAATAELFREQLAHFRSTFGVDYHSFTT